VKVDWNYFKFVLVCCWFNIFLFAIKHVTPYFFVIKLVLKPFFVCLRVKTEAKFGLDSSWKQPMCKGVEAVIAREKLKAKLATLKPCLVWTRVKTETNWAAAVLGPLFGFGSTVDTVHLLELKWFANDIYVRKSWVKSFFGSLFQVFLNVPKKQGKGLQWVFWCFFALGSNYPKRWSANTSLDTRISCKLRHRVTLGYKGLL